MKKCPYCAEEIQDEAIKCRFCGEFLKKKKWWQGCLIGCLITLILSPLLLFLFFYFSFFLFKLIIYKIFFAAPANMPHYYPPFIAPGFEEMFKNFAEFLRNLWYKLIELLHFGPMSRSL